MIPRSQIDQVREIDITSLVESYGVSLKGFTTKKGLCPFHNENSPSFVVREDWGTYYCFGCGEKGDVIQFVREMENLDFTEAVKLLGEKFRIEITDEHASDKDAQQAGKKKRLFSLMETIAEFYQANFRGLPESHAAKKNLQDRGLYSVPDVPQEEWWSRFGVGWAPEGFQNTLAFARQQGFTEQECLDAGIASRTGKGRVIDFQRGRLTFEIRDVQGRPVGFGGRRIFEETDKGPKYLNSPATLLYDKSRTLYGLDVARRAVASQKEVVIAEGYTDVMALAAAGIHHAVAPCGTAFSEGHAHTLLRLLPDTGRLVFNFDGDEAGQKAAGRTFTLEAPIHTKSYIARSENGSGDPCDIRMQEGDEAVRAMVSRKNTVSLTEFVLRTELAHHDTDSPEGKSTYLAAVSPLLSHITDPTMREDYLRKVAFWSGGNIDIVRNALEGRGISPRPRTQNRANSAPTTAPAASHAQSRQHDIAPINPFEDPPPSSEYENVDPFGDLPPMDAYEDDEANTVTAPPQKSMLRRKQESWAALYIQNPRRLRSASFPDLPEDLATVVEQIRRGEKPDVSKDFILDLLHKPFPDLDGVSDEEYYTEIVSRLEKALSKAILHLAQKEESKAAQARWRNAFSDDNEDPLSGLDSLVVASKNRKPADS